ncbi:outer membrane beta-barrel protein [Candidatus Electrothrix sp.]|uniref:outer membrane beta-barrel protein n=1 Tax=Candidatus Electrothrix sp. TaxID=2170559 RepID=UPI0040579B89
MKRGIVSTGILALLIGMAGQAQASRIGMHGAYSNGGDVEEPEVGIGGQIEFPINHILSVEFAVSYFSEEFEGSNGTTIDQDLTSFGVSAVFRRALGPQLGGYMLFGADYNTIDTESNFHNVNMELDDEIGFHIGTGLNLAINYNMELFAEYRYTFLETEGDVEMTGGLLDASLTDGDYEYDFGLAKLGLNFLF